MTTPLFTADISVYQTSQSYYGVSTVKQSNGAIHLEQMSQGEDCFLKCLGDRGCSSLGGVPQGDCVRSCHCDCNYPAGMGHNFCQQPPCTWLRACCGPGSLPASLCCPVGTRAGCVPIIIS